MLVMLLEEAEMQSSDNSLVLLLLLLLWVSAACHLTGKRMRDQHKNKYTRHATGCLLQPATVTSDGQNAPRERGEAQVNTIIASSSIIVNNSSVSRCQCIFPAGNSDLLLVPGCLCANIAAPTILRLIAMHLSSSPAGRLAPGVARQLRLAPAAVVAQTTTACVPLLRQHTRTLTATCALPQVMKRLWHHN